MKCILTWSENCILTDNKTQTARGARGAINAPTNPAFKKSIDYLSYHLKMKTVEDLFQSIMYQMFK